MVAEGSELITGSYRLGGGDQIYCDSIRVSGPLRTWTDISNPKKRREYPFPESLRADCDDWYLKNYIRWYVARTDSCLDAPEWLTRFALGTGQSLLLRPTARFRR